MKKGIIKGVQKIGGEKSYIPDESLVKFIQDWLQIHKKREQLTKEGKELSEEDKKRLRESDRMKVYILDNMIFPALANLTYFFEAMASSSRLTNAFADELKEILDPRKAKDASQFFDGMRMSSMQFRQNNLARLIIASLEIPMKNYPKKQMVDDFRIGIMYQLLNIIGDRMDSLLFHEYSHSPIWKSFMDDYNKIQGWIGLLTRSMEEPPKEYDRKLGFLPIWLSSKVGIRKLDF